MRHLVLVLAAIGCAVAFSASSASAASILFIHEASGSGSLAGVPFDTSDFTITATGDTSNRVFLGWADAYYINHDAAAIDIAGLGTMTFLIDTRTFVANGVAGVGFSKGGDDGPDLFDGPIGDPAFATWDMLSSIGPIAGFGGALQWGSGIETDRGLLVLDDSWHYGAYWDVPTAFQAIVGGAAVPAPGAVLLVALGTGLVGWFRRRGSV